MQKNHLSGQLKKACHALHLDLSTEQAVQIQDYLDLLTLWNAKFNLTAIKDPQQMLIKHIFDSLSVLPYLAAGRLLDVGTGAGLPGLIIAIMRPDQKIFLLDSNAKKVRFLRQVISELGITNATAVQCRVEQANHLGKFDVIISRAFASLTDFVALTIPMLNPKGVLVAMKGLVPDAEVMKLDNQYAVNVRQLTVPLLNDARCMITITNKR